MLVTNDVFIVPHRVEVENVFIMPFSELLLYFFFLVNWHFITSEAVLQIVFQFVRDLRVLDSEEV